MFVAPNVTFAAPLASRSLRHPSPTPVCTGVRLHVTLKIAPVRPHSVPDLRPPSARIGAPTVTFLHDRRTERDVSRPLTPAIGAANVTPYTPHHHI